MAKHLILILCMAVIAAQAEERKSWSSARKQFASSGKVPPPAYRHLVPGPFHVAASKNDVATLRQLVKRGQDINAVHEATGTTALSIASAKRQYHAIEFLVANGAHLNQADKTGYTPLFYAMTHRDKKLFKWLLKKGADPQHIGGYNVTPLMFATARGDIEAFDLLMDVGVDFAGLDMEGNNLVYYAVMSGSAKLLERVLQFGLDVNHLNDGGTTALAVAERLENARVASLLRNNGATTLGVVTGEKGEKVALEAFVRGKSIK